MSYDRSKTNGLAAAAKATIVVVQEELEKLLLLGRDPLEHAVAFELGYAKAWVICALRQVCTDSEAKRIELGLTGGAPLTICTGMTSYRANEAAYLITPFLGRVVNVSVIHRGKARPGSAGVRLLPHHSRHDPDQWEAMAILV